MKRKRAHRAKGEISLACYLMRRGLLDVCLDCGTVYRYHRGRRRKMTQKEHYKGYLWVDIHHRNIKRRGAKKNWRMSAWIHRLSYMKKRAVREFKRAKRDGNLIGPADWKSFVVDLPATMDIDHGRGGIKDNRGKNLRLRTHAGNSGKRPMTAEERAEVEAFDSSF